MAEATLKLLIKTLESAVADFQASIPGIQKDIYIEVQKLIKGLDISGDTIRPTVKNLREIAKFKRLIQRIIDKSDYPDKLDKFIEAFGEVADIQNKYFISIEKGFKPSALMEEIKIQAIDSTIESLTEGGLNQNFIEPVKELLRKNVTTGGSYSELVSQVRDTIVNTKAGDGKLEKYVKQTTTDALNQYAGQYMDAATNDLGLDWFMYDGAIIDTSRQFCIACVKKKYIHRSEFPALIKGDFKEFKAIDGQIYDKTGLPDGMIKGTNSSNLTVLRGGYNCEHQFIPVSRLVVPKDIRDKYPD